MTTKTQSVRSITTTNPLSEDQYYLGALGDLTTIWRDYRGEGVSVGVYDDGVDYNHEDLDDNYDASLHPDVGGAPFDPFPEPVEEDMPPNAHGTAVAGIIAAEDNGVGVIGIAHGASLTGLNFFSTALDEETLTRTIYSALGRFDVTNHSYGPVFPDFGASTGFQPNPSVSYFMDAVENGRNGLGTISFVAAGNEAGNSNSGDLANYRALIAVGAVDETLVVSSYSNIGANLMVVAPSDGNPDQAAVVTTDQSGAVGYTTGDYARDFGGTSAASPMAAGVATLMLDANPNLGWRDVYEILSLSARHTGSDVGTGASGNELFTWFVNGSENWNGGGRHYSEDYGFGLLDAFAAVRLAEVWSEFGPAQTSANEASLSNTQAGRVDIPDVDSTEVAFTVSGDLEVEWVQLEMTLTHSYFADLNVTLTSPDGTTSVLLTPATNRYTDDQGQRVVLDIADDGFTHTFGLVGFRGEMAEGTWTLRFTDTAPEDTGTVENITLTAFGRDGAQQDLTRDVYHYTDEFAEFRALDASRNTLADTDGGTDFINGAALTSDMVLYLETGVQSLLGGEDFITIAEGSLIENALGGDGNDRIVGNELDNRIHGNRGNDILEGAGGRNMLDGGEGTDTAIYDGDFGNYVLSIDGSTETLSLSDKRAGDGEVDTLASVELVSFADGFSFGNNGLFDLREITGAVGLSEDMLLTFVEMYVAYFDRAPDALGLNYWGTRLADGMGLGEIAQSFFFQDETFDLYPELDGLTEVNDPSSLSIEFYTQLVTDTYSKLLERGPDAAGEAFWIGELETGAVKLGEFVLAIINGAKDFNPDGATDEQIAQAAADTQTVEEKGQLGYAFAVEGGMNDVDNAADVMGTYDIADREGSLSAAEALIAEYRAAAEAADSTEILVQISTLGEDPLMIA
ncbi:MAG: S8 family serine peptidase [Pseudomonadota bacterium]